MSRRVCAPPLGLSSQLGNDLTPRLVVHGDRIHGTCLARAQQPLALHPLRLGERGDRVGVQFETLRGFRGTIAEPDALVAVDHDAQPMGRSLVQAHMPSSPSSLRALSITAGVISAMPRSLA